jgi:nuclear transport factor 2 (NTF2) superfamily protein
LFPEVPYKASFPKVPNKASQLGFTPSVSHYIPAQEPDPSRISHSTEIISMSRYLTRFNVQQQHGFARHLLQHRPKSSSVVEVESKSPFPPFTKESALQKIRLAEDAWNSQNPDKVKMAYSKDTLWRNRSTFLKGRDEVRDFLSGKWDREQHYRLIKELWAYNNDNNNDNESENKSSRIAVRFCYEYQNRDDGIWYRAHGNENWEFDEHGLMTHRHASINDVPIQENERKFLWPQGARPADHPGLSDLGL